MTRAILIVALLLAVPASSADAPRRDALFGPDKAFHVIVGVSIGAATHSLTTAYAPDVDPLMAAVVSSFAAATFKEVLDATGLGTPSHLDLLWTIVGGLVGSAVSAGVQWMFMGLKGP